MGTVDVLLNMLREDKMKKWPSGREPETLEELEICILEQLEKSETVYIKLTDGDGLQELLNEIEAGIIKKHIPNDIRHRQMGG